MCTNQVEKQHVEMFEEATDLHERRWRVVEMKHCEKEVVNDFRSLEDLQESWIWVDDRRSRIRQLVEKELRTQNNT